MPLIDLNAAAAWNGGPDSLYISAAGGGLTRAAKQDFWGNDVDRLIAALIPHGLTVGQRIVIVGATFGWTAERFLELGYGPYANGTAAGKLLAVDTSTWIQANVAGNASLSISNADVNAATGRRAIRQEFGSNQAVIDWIITDKFLMFLTGTGPTPGGTNEIVPFCNNLRSLATNVAHWIVVRVPGGENGGQDQRLNWKTLAEWQAWTTPDIVIAVNEIGAQPPDL